MSNQEEVKLKAKVRMLKHRYGITLDEYNQMYIDQDGKCPICEKDYPLGGYKGLYVDHDHETNEVRGLLCPTCNSTIGKLKDSKILFENAIKYLNI